MEKETTIEKDKYNVLLNYLAKTHGCPASNCNPATSEYLRDLAGPCGWAQCHCEDADAMDECGSEDKAACWDKYAEEEAAK